LIISIIIFFRQITLFRLRLRYAFLLGFADHISIRFTMITPDISPFSSLLPPAFMLIRRRFRHYATPMTLLMPFSDFS
jgi:hypothetical protein